MKKRILACALALMLFLGMTFALTPTTLAAEGKTVKYPFTVGGGVATFSFTVTNVISESDGNKHSFYLTDDDKTITGINGSKVFRCNTSSVVTFAPPDYRKYDFLESIGSFWDGNKVKDGSKYTGKYYYFKSGPTMFEDISKSKKYDKVPDNDKIGWVIADGSFFTFSKPGEYAVEFVGVESEEQYGVFFIIVENDSPKVTPPPLPPRQEKPTGTVQIGSFTLNVRKYPMSAADTVVTLKNGAKVEYFEKSGAWVRVVTDDKKEGWVASAYLSTSPYAQKAGDTAKVFSGTLNLRAEASSSAKILKTLKNGNTVKILDNTSSKAWIKVDSNGVVGWVAASYIGKGI